jgi:uncharacterized protein YuzE
MNEKVNYDSKSDTLYLLVEEGIEAKFVEVAPGINVELDEAGRLIGIEILNASRLLPLVIKQPQPLQSLAPAVLPLR